MEDGSGVEQGHRLAAPRGVGGASLAVSLAIVVALGAGAVALDRSRAVASAAPGQYRLVMTDYAFAPDRIRVRPGERVTLTIVNRSQSVPGKDHELMFGRVPIMESSAFGPVPGDGFEQPLLGDAEVGILEARGVTMLMPGPARLVGERLNELLVPMVGAMPGMGDMQAPAAPTPSMGPMQMPGMGGMPMQPTPTPMSGGRMPGMQMPPASPASGAQMPGMDAAQPSSTSGSLMPGMQMPTPTPGMAGIPMGPGPTPTAEMGGMPMAPSPPAGPSEAPGMVPMYMSRDRLGLPMPPARAMDQFMAVLAQDGVLTISFVVPDRPGVWEYGCFAQTGQHYLNGMRGRLEIATSAARPTGGP